MFTGFFHYLALASSQSEMIGEFMHVHHQDREMCIMDDSSVSLELGITIVFFVV